MSSDNTPSRPVTEPQLLAPEVGAGTRSKLQAKFDTENHEVRENPILRKIKDTLGKTDPERWERAGEDLRPGGKYPKSQDSWEQIYCLDVANGVLVLRSSTPLSSKYFGGSYQLTPNGPTGFTVEMKPRGFTPRMIIDPFYRTTAAGTSGTVLVDGDIAEELYAEVDAVVRNYHTSRKRDFDAQVERLQAELPHLIETMLPEAWEKDETEKNIVKFRGEIDHAKILVARMTTAEGSAFRLEVTRYGLTWESRNWQFAKHVFFLVHELKKGAALKHLEEVLKDCGL